jgi:hypothetical protein
MAKVLNEQGFVMRFVEAIFDSILRERNAALRKVMEQDPKFRQIVTNLERGKKELEQWAAEKTAGDPEAQKDAEVAHRLTHWYEKKQGKNG